MYRRKLKTRNGPVEYTIAHRPRVTRRLHMELDEDGGLVVVAPKHWSKRHINSTLTGNAGRVEKFLARARAQRLKPLKYIHGEAHLYLGNRYPLSITAGTGRRPSVILMDQEIRIGIRSQTGSDIEAILHAWYRAQASRVFTERLEEVRRRAHWTRGRSIPLKLRRMKRTWGNCSSQGVIKLNTHLVKASPAVIDSVIAHELCHLEEMNHSSKFYALLENLNPNWREDREHLRSRGNQYLL